MKTMQIATALAELRTLNKEVLEANRQLRAASGGLRHDVVIIKAQYDEMKKSHEELKSRIGVMERQAAVFMVSTNDQLSKQRVYADTLAKVWCRLCLR
jgi:phage shock protein A